MPTLKLTPPTQNDVEALLRFESDNRAFFEAHINARPPGYYSLEGVRQAIDEAISDARMDRAYQHLVRDPAGDIVGRVNLSRVRRAHFHSAELGYRIAQSACGKGYAREAVRLVLARAFDELGLHRLEATARPENIGSSRILQQHGFVPFGQSSRCFELAGHWYDLVYYERHAPI